MGTWGVDFVSKEGSSIPFALPQWEGVTLPSEGRCESSPLYLSWPWTDFDHENAEV